MVETDLVKMQEEQMVDEKRLPGHARDGAARWYGGCAVQQVVGRTER
jgi:hypothetical protein